MACFSTSQSAHTALYGAHHSTYASILGHQIQHLKQKLDHLMVLNIQLVKELNQHETLKHGNLTSFDMKLIAKIKQNALRYKGIKSQLDARIKKFLSILGTDRFYSNGNTAKLVFAIIKEELQNLVIQNHQLLKILKNRAAHGNGKVTPIDTKLAEQIKKNILRYKEINMQLRGYIYRMHKAMKAKQARRNHAKNMYILKVFLLCFIIICIFMTVLFIYYKKKSSLLPSYPVSDYQHEAIQ